MTNKIEQWVSLGPHRFLEDAPIAVIVADDHAKITWANKAAVTLFGYSRGELTGQQIDMLLPADVRGRHEAHFAGWVQHPRARQMGAGINIAGLNKNGEVLALDVQLSPIETDSGIMAMAWVRERSDPVAVPLLLTKEQAV